MGVSDDAGVGLGRRDVGFRRQHARLPPLRRRARRCCAGRRARCSVAIDGRHDAHHLRKAQGGPGRGSIGNMTAIKAARRRLLARRHGRLLIVQDKIALRLIGGCPASSPAASTTSS
ncbi:hypothetical protein AB5I41_11380 [Sphingomonas sp. MMS24-JH45]